MTIQELKDDPSIIRNEEGNILCIKTKTNREHHLKPEMVINEARMQNEGWMVKRKPVANGNGLNNKTHDVAFEMSSEADFSQKLQEAKTPEKIPIFGLPETQYEIPVSQNVSESEVVNDTPTSNYETITSPVESKTKKKGGRPVGSKNKTKRKTKVNS